MESQSRRSLLIGKGLLGSAIVRAIALDSPNRSGCLVAQIPWHDGPAAIAAMRVYVAELMSSESARYDIYWCAGRATPRSDSSLAAAEVNHFESLMAVLQTIAPEHRATLRVFVASSAGALYATSNGVAALESTPVTVRDAYGAAKVRIEGLAVDYATKMGVGLVIGRISSLFGPGQSLDKPQGLLNHVAWSVLSRQPVIIHVDRMSTRNYLHIADAAEFIVGCMDRCDPPEVVIQNVCSQRHYSIAEIVQTVEKTFARRANVLYLGPGVRSDLRVASDRTDLVHRHSRRSLASGFAGIATDLRLQFSCSGAVPRRGA